MKNRIGKRALSLLLAALVCLSLLPMTALAGGSYVAVVNIAEPAQNPTTAAMLYNNGTVGAAYNGASYDSATNMLTLNGFCNAGQYIEINNMGNDFKLAVKNSNTVGIVEVFGGSLTITGDGDLTVNPNGGATMYNGAYSGIHLEAEGGNAVLTVESGPTVTALGYNANQAVTVTGTTAADGIIVEGDAGAAVKSERRIKQISVQNEGDVGPTSLMLYAYGGGWYGAFRFYSSYSGTTTTVSYSMYTLTGDPDAGFTAYAPIRGESNLSAVPEKYSPVYDALYDHTLADAAGVPLNYVSIAPGDQTARPTITTTSLPSGKVGEAYTATLSGTAADSSTLSWSVEGSLPAGLALNAETGVISGTPTAAGSFSFAVKATQGNGKTAMKSLSISVSQPATHTVRFELNGGTATPGANYSARTGVADGEAITLPAAPTRRGYAFRGWNSRGTNYAAGSEADVLGNMTFTAAWDAQTVTFPFAPELVGYVALYGVSGSGRENLCSSYLEEPEALTDSNAFTLSAERCSGFTSFALCAIVDGEETEIATRGAVDPGDAVNTTAALTSKENFRILTGVVVKAGGKTLEKGRDYYDFALTSDSENQLYSVPCLIDKSGTYSGNFFSSSSSEIYRDYDFSQAYTGTYDESTHTLTFTLDPAAKVTVGGTVTMNGTPLSGVTVRASENGDKSVELAAATDTDGKYSFDLYPGGSVYFNVSSGGQPLSVSRGYELALPAGESGPATHDLTVNYASLNVSFRLGSQDQEALIDRYLNALPNQDSVLTVSRGGAVVQKFSGWQLNLYKPDFTRNFNLSSVGPTDALTVKLSGSRIAGEASVDVTLDGGIGSVTLDPTLQCGVVGTLVAGSHNSGQFYLAWYDSAGACAGETDPFFAGGSNRDIAAVCPGNPGQYTLLLLPSTYKGMLFNFSDHAAPSRMTLDLAKRAAVKAWENITLTAGKITELEPFTITAGMSEDAEYVTKPASTLACGTDSFTDVSDMVMFNGSIGLDPGLTGGKLAGLNIVTQPGDGNTAVIQSLIIAGKTYMPGVSSTGYYYIDLRSGGNAVIDLPCDYTIYCKPGAETMDMDVQVTATVTYDGGERNNQLVGSAVVKKPGSFVTTLSPFVCHDQITVTGVAKKNEVVTIYDNGVEVGRTRGDDRSGKWTANITLNGVDSELATVHPITAATASGTVSEETTVIHQTGGPELTSFTMAYNGGQPFDVLGGAYIYPMRMSDVTFTATFDNPDELKNLGGEDGFNCEVVIRFLTTNGKIYHWKAEHRGDGVFVATQPGNIGSSITEAEVLFDAEIVKPFYNEETRTYALSTDLNNLVDKYIDEMQTTYGRTLAEDRERLKNATPANNWSISFGDNFTPNVSSGVSGSFDSEKLKALAEASHADGVTLRSMGMEYGITDTSPLAKWMQASVDDKLTDHPNEDQIYMASILFGNDADLTAEENVAKTNAIVEAHTEGGSSSVYTITDGEYNDDGGLTDASYALILQFSRDANRGLYVLGATLLLDETYTGEARQVAAASATRSVPALRAVSDMSYASPAPGLMLAKNISTSTRMVEDYYHGQAPVPSSDGASFFHFDASGVADFSANGFGAGGLGQCHASSATGVGFSAIGYFLTQYEAGQREGFYRRMLRDLNHLMSTSCYHNLSYQQKVRCANLYNDFLKTYKRTLERNQETVDISRLTLLAGAGLCVSGVGGIPGIICLVGGSYAGWKGADNAVKAEIETILSYNSAYNQMAFLMYNKDDPNCNKDKFKIREIREFVSNSGLTVANDPSGVVYEGVIENPVEGAAVTLYHAVDGSGGLVREAQAAAVANIIPASGVNGLIPEEWVQITGADGRFQWGVPEGLWYVTAQAGGLVGNSNDDTEAKVTLSPGIQVGGQAVSNLLPVLPVQMNVNIPLTDPAAPTVKDVQFTTDGVYVTFSKYMQENSSGTGAYDGALDADSYVLTDSNGEKIALTAASEERGHTPDNRGEPTTYYTRTVVLKRADEATLSGEFYLLVRGSVKSYAGTPMGSDYASGAQAVTQKVTLAPPAFSGTNKSGTAFSNSSQVTQVMALGESVTLTAAAPEGKNVSIYYTTDGTSPNEDSKLYERPIPITNAVTITAIAVCPGYTASDAAAGTFTVGETHIISVRVSPYDASLSTDGVAVTLSGNGVSRTARVLNGSAAFDGLSNGIYTLSFAATASFSATTVSVTVDGSNKQVPVTLQRAGTEDPVTPVVSGGGIEATYQIILAETAHGSVTVSRVTAPKGAEITLTVTPDAGYTQSGIKVLDAKGNTLAVTDHKFTMPASDVTVTVTFEAVKKDRPFTDVKESDWFYAAVYHCFDAGYFKGVSETLFDPQGTMTRAMFATVLWRIAGKPAAVGGKSFHDVKAGEWYTDAVLWASGKGILDGYGDGSFGANDPVTREQMVTLLWRFSGKPAGTADLSGYKDADQISDWAKEAFGWAINVGLVQGKGDGVLDPGGKATRAEVAQIVMNYDTKVK